jgi:hypothetical protein
VRRSPANREHILSVGMTIRDDRLRNLAERVGLGSEGEVVITRGPGGQPPSLKSGVAICRRPERCAAPISRRVGPPVRAFGRS